MGLGKNPCGHHNKDDHQQDKFKIFRCCFHGFGFLLVITFVSYEVFPHFLHVIYDSAAVVVAVEPEMEEVEGVEEEVEAAA